MRLTGLGVSPGIGVGKALVLKGGTGTCGSAFRGARVERELARLEEARRRVARRRSSRSRRASPASRGAEHAYLFDAQLLMLDDPMLVDRASTIIRDERLNAESALQRALDEMSALFDEAHDSYLRERKGRRRRRRRAAAHEPARRRRRRRISSGTRRAAGPGCRRDHPVGHRATRLAAAGRAGHRRRQLDVSHRDPRALDPHSGGRRSARRQRPDRAGRAGRGGRRDRRRVRRSGRRHTGADHARASGSRLAFEAVARSSSATCRRSPRTASRSGSRPTSRIPDDAARALERGAAGHRAVPIGVPAGRRRAPRH